jgi:hypothetical protein
MNSSAPLRCYPALRPRKTASASCTTVTRSSNLTRLSSDSCAAVAAISPALNSTPGQPLVLDLGVPIVESLDPDPNSLHVTQGDTAIEIEPMLIRRGSTLQGSLLTEGRPVLTCVNPLIDVRASRQSSLPNPSPARIPAMVTTGITLLWLTALLTATHEITWDGTQELMAAAFGAFGIAFRRWLELRRSRVTALRRGA